MRPYRVDDAQPGEGGAIEARIARQERIRLHLGVSPDQEIRHDARSWRPDFRRCARQSFAGKRRRVDRGTVETDAENVEDLQGSR